MYVCMHVCMYVCMYIYIYRYTICTVTYYIYIYIYNVNCNAPESHLRLLDFSDHHLRKFHQRFEPQLSLGWCFCLLVTNGCCPSTPWCFGNRRGSDFTNIPAGALSLMDAWLRRSRVLRRSGWEDSVPILSYWTFSFSGFLLSWQYGKPNANALHLPVGDDENYHITVTYQQLEIAQSRSQTIQVPRSHHAPLDSSLLKHVKTNSTGFNLFQSNDDI